MLVVDYGVRRPLTDYGDKGDPDPDDFVWEYAVRVLDDETDYDVASCVVLVAAIFEADQQGLTQKYILDAHSEELYECIAVLQEVPSEKLVRICGLQVAPDLRRLGVGSAVVKRVVADFANQEGTLVVVEPVPFADELDHSEDEDLRETEEWKRLHAELVVFYTRLGFVMHPSGLMYLVPEET